LDGDAGGSIAREGTFGKPSFREFFKKESIYLDTGDHGHEPNARLRPNCGSSKRAQSMNRLHGEPNAWAIAVGNSLVAALTRGQKHAAASFPR
jgi:hypothetical protein